MLVTSDGPRGEPMALRAVIAEPLEMGISTVMATRAVERLACGAGIELIGVLDAQPSLQRTECGIAVGVSTRCAR